jgi:hypothetical protein
VTRDSQTSQLTELPTHGPNASRASRPGPPLLSKRLPTSAKQSTISNTTAAHSKYATRLCAPISACTFAGRPKMPAPTMPFRNRAARS